MLFRSDALVTAYCNGIGLAGKWIDTSYIGARRARYAGVGMVYDADKDEFIAPEAPVAAPAADAAKS